MATLVHSGYERPARVRAPSGVKSILFYVHNDDGLDARLETALALARACGAHLTLQQVVPTQAYVTFDTFGGVYVLDELLKTVEEQNQQLRDRLDAKLAREDVAFDIVETGGELIASLAGRAALSDLLMIGREPTTVEFAGRTTGIFGELLHQSRTPLFIPGSQPLPDICGTAMIAWDGSHEAANAVRAAVGLLGLADRVEVFRVEEPKAEAFGIPAVLEYLSRHGIHAELRTETLARGEQDPNLVASLLVAEAKRIGAAYLVMGGYSHSRLGEYLFGGVTRELLRSSSVALFVAH